MCCFDYELDKAKRRYKLGMAYNQNEKGKPKLPFFDAALRGKINAIKR